MRHRNSIKIKLPSSSYEERCAARWPDRYGKVESTEDFKLRLRRLIGSKPIDRTERPIVRTPEDRGYYPPN